MRFVVRKSLLLKVCGYAGATCRRVDGFEAHGEGFAG
jgi:hypothetical protein